MKNGNLDKVISILVSIGLSIAGFTLVKLYESRSEKIRSISLEVEKLSREVMFCHDCCIELRAKYGLPKRCEHH